MLSLTLLAAGAVGCVSAKTTRVEAVDADRVAANCPAPLEP